MTFNFDTDAMNKIQNPSDVNCFCSHSNEKTGKCSLFAHMTDGQVLQLTEEKHKLTYPFHAIEELEKHVGKRYMRNFGNFNSLVAINIENFVGYSINNSNEKKYKDVIAHFNGGEQVNLYSIREKYLDEVKTTLSKIASMKDHTME